MAGPPIEITLEDDDGRYHRQELISWWEQERLAGARVVVVGAGALGNELLKNLALLGVGRILVIDMDRIENSNLSRCVLFREHDEGALKAEVAAAAVRELNPEVRIEAIAGDVRIDVGLGVFASADLVLGGLDNREARLHINQCCWKVGTPWIDGAIEGLMGTVRLFLPPDSACYECTMSEADHRLMAHRKSCALLSREQMLEGKVPTTATSASVIAAMQVQEAIKLLHRDKIEPTLAGRGYAYNGLTNDSYVVTYRRRDDCLSHDTYAPADRSAVSADVTFGELLGLAADELANPVLDLEHEVVLSVQCATCGTDEQIRLPTERLTSDSVRCPNCHGERRPISTHSVCARDAELLALSPAQLGLPRFDYISARSGAARRHFQLEGDVDVFEALVPA